MIHHIVPTKDLIAHKDDGSPCDCCPMVEFLENGDTLVIHNAWDGREILEELDRDKQNKWTISDGENLTE